MGVNERLWGMFFCGGGFFSLVISFIDGADGFATPTCVAYACLVVAIVILGRTIFRRPIGLLAGELATGLSRTGAVSDSKNDLSTKPKGGQGDG